MAPVPKLLSAALIADYAEKTLHRVLERIPVPVFISHQTRILLFTLARSHL